MVTTTTKTLNYAITKGSSTNSVNATITSTPGFNSNYLGKLPGILKLLELILACVALGLIASRRMEERPLIITPTPFPGYSTTSLPPGSPAPRSYWHEMFLIGEVYFLCSHFAVITLLVIVLIAYLFHTTSAMIIPKATTLENVMNLVLALMLIAAGIVEITMTEMWKSADGRELMDTTQEGIRVAAGVLALVNGILFIVSLVMSRKELAGPKTL